MINIILFLGMLSLTVAANLLVKVGASKSTIVAEHLVPKQMHRARLINPVLLLGIVCFFSSLLFLTLLLQRLPLYLVQAYGSLQYIAVILAAAVILAEPIPKLRWCGIVLIAIGILIIGVTHA